MKTTSRTSQPELFVWLVLDISPDGQRVCLRQLSAKPKRLREGQTLIRKRRATGTLALVAPDMPVRPSQPVPPSVQALLDMI